MSSILQQRQRRFQALCLYECEYMTAIHLKMPLMSYKIC